MSPSTQPELPSRRGKGTPADRSAKLQPVAQSRPYARLVGRAFLAALALTTAGWLGFEWADRAYPPPLPERLTVSTEVRDRDGALLRAFATPDGRWRLDTTTAQVDRKLTEMLIAYEDKRFWDHKGIDALALLRAAGQFATSGRIVSGGSTLSMQLARLIEPRASRSLGSKARQLFRAMQIERRLTKQQILDRYLTLAPYGGNLESVRAASLAWFGKEPRVLTVSESALLVSLPQLPERRRPDRNPQNALTARDRVLDRMVSAGVLDQPEADRAKRDDLPKARLALPLLAPHASEAALRRDPSAATHKLTLKASAQRNLEAVARDAARKLGQKLSVAMIMADAHTGQILAEVGSADFFDATRHGWIDMTRVVRSPGSTLKPFIYGLAFEQGLIAQETMVEDRPADFAGYRPKNFDLAYQGDVTIRTALQMSLNVPAVRLLDAVGPARLTTRFKQAGVVAQLPKDEPPGLAIALGGVGMSLRDLVQLYTGLANFGKPRALHDGSEANEPEQPTTAVLDARATWQIGDVLSGVVPPEGASRRGIAYKTGTSYGYRDAWSVGYDGRYVLGVWTGRADGQPVPGIAGYVTAAPILFEAFERSGIAAVPMPKAPPGALRQPADQLPVTLRRFDTDGGLVVTASTEPPPTILFPPDGAHLARDDVSQEALPVALKLQGGRAPFRWLANGKAVAPPDRRRESAWQPDTTGYSTLTVIDAAGRAASVKIFVE